MQNLLSAVEPPLLHISGCCGPKWGICRKENMDTEVKVHVDMTEVEEYISKAKELERLLKEAKSLADDLASVDLTMEIKV